MNINLRKSWFLHVKRTRLKLQRKDKKNKVTHKTAMSEASKTWEDVKLKILRKRQREKKKLEKELKKDTASKGGKTTIE